MLMICGNVLFVLSLLYLALGIFSRRQMSKDEMEDKVLNMFESIALFIALISLLISLIGYFIQ